MLHEWNEESRIFHPYRKHVDFYKSNNYRFTHDVKQKMFERTLQVVFLHNFPYGGIARQPTLSQVLISDVRLVVGTQVRTTLHPSTVGISSVQGQETIVTYRAITSQIKNNSVLQKEATCKTGIFWQKIWTLPVSSSSLLMIMTHDQLQSCTHYFIHFLLLITSSNYSAPKFIILPHIHPSLLSPATGTWNMQGPFRCPRGECGLANGNAIQHWIHLTTWIRTINAKVLRHAADGASTPNTSDGYSKVEIFGEKKMLGIQREFV